MILAFQKQFVEPILDGTKIHTIREDAPGRWKAGNNIHAATGVRTPKYHCFFESECVSTQSIEIKYNEGFPVHILVDGRDLYFSERHLLAVNDGFDGLYDFFKWFNTDFKGKIIHWTDFRY